MIDEIVTALSNLWNCCQPLPPPPPPTGCCVYVWTAEINRYIIPSNPGIRLLVECHRHVRLHWLRRHPGRAQANGRWIAAEIAYLQAIGYNEQLQAFPPTVTTFNFNGSPATIAGQFIICNESC